MADETPGFTLGARTAPGTPRTEAPPGPADGQGLSAAPRRIVPRSRRRLVTLADYWDDRMKGRASMERLEGVDTVRGLLGALGFDAPREMYFPSPEQRAFTLEKTLVIVPKDISPSDGPRKDCSVRVCAPRSCLVYVNTLEVTPLNLTAQESLVVRSAMQCGTQRSIIDFCEVVSQANEEPGQYTKPQHFLIPPTGCLVVDFYNEDEFSEALVLVEATAWLVPDKEDAAP